MKKIISIAAMVVLLATFLVSPAAAESQELLDRVDIGDPASEAGHNLDGWGPLEPDTHPWLDYGAPWSELGDGKARVIWTVGGDYPCATLTLDRHIAAGTASVIRFRHLDGLHLTGYDRTERWADDSFTVSVKNHGDADSAYQQVYEYTASGRTDSTSRWLVHEFDLPSSLNLDEDIDVKFCATAPRWEYFGSDLGQVAFDWIELWGEEPSPPEECNPCEGGVTTLTFQYNGTETASVMVKTKKGDVILFDAAVSPGDTFTVNGADKKGKLGTEIKIFVDGEEYTRIHTSCSQPIGVGMVFGNFEIVGGESLKGGPLCPIPDIPECGECKGGVTTLTFQYNGTAAADVMVKAKKGDVILFDAAVSPGDMFTVNGADKKGKNADKKGKNGDKEGKRGDKKGKHGDKKGKLGTEIKIFVNGEEYTIHTSCSQPIGAGMIFGDFEIVGGESLKGGVFCINGAPAE